MSLSKEQEEMLRNPKPGTACARARDFGIDLTLNIIQLRLTMEERLSKLEDYANGILQMRQPQQHRRK